MAGKLNKVVAVTALNSICDEATHNVNSGDIRVAGEARRDYLTATILLQLLSNVDDETFNNVELAKLPTPEELQSAMDDSGNTTAINIANSLPPIAPSQPSNADDLSSQSGGAVPVTTQPPASDTTQPPASNTTQPPASDTTQPPASNITQPPASDTTQPPASDTTTVSDSTDTTLPVSE